MEIGKLPHHFLARMLADVRLDNRVVVGPGIGIDAAVIDFGDRLLVSKTDPITFATDLIGWYAVNVNANDIAVMGATPKWFMATILLPENADDSMVEDIFEQIKTACADLEIALVGGHTEITYDLNRPIIVGCMLGETDRANLVTSAGAKEGDDIIVTKGVGIEGTSILAREGENLLLEMGFLPEFLNKAANFLFEPGISVIRDAKIAQDAVNIHAMHDPTEGGLATGLMEIAEASGLGVEIVHETIPILPKTQTICRELNLDPLGLISSGSLLLTLAPEDTPRLLDAFGRAKLNANVIGTMTSKAQGLKMTTPKGVQALPSFPRDEIARFFDEA